MDKSTPGSGRARADIAIRLQYAKRVARKNMSTRALAKALQEEFGRAVERHHLVDILLAKGATLRTRPDRQVGGSPRIGAAERLAYAESVATNNMTSRELLELVRRRFGIGIDEQTLRRVLVRKGAPRNIRRDREPYRGVVKPGITPASGAGKRRFKSSHLDHPKMSKATRIAREQELARRVAATLKEWRVTLGLSQSEMAKLTDMPASSVARLEAGSLTPSLATLDRVAVALDIPLSYLLV